MKIVLIGIGLLGLIVLLLIVSGIGLLETRKDTSDQLKRTHGKLPYSYSCFKDRSDFEAKRTGGKDRVGRPN